MSTILKINKAVEKIIIPTDDDQEDIVLQVFTDDKNIELTLHQVGNAMDRFAALNKKLETAENEEDTAKAQEAMARLFKRTISAIVGEDGWNTILTYIGDGKPADPAQNILTLGEVFAALVTWLYDHCTSKQLRNAGVYFQKEQKNAKKVTRKKARRN